MGYLRLLLPIAELGTLYWLYSRIAYRRYPALMTYIATEAAAQTAVILAGSWWVQVWTVIQPIRLAIRAWVACEVYRFACVKTTRAQRIKLGIYAAGAAMLCTLPVLALVHFHPGYVYRAFALFRQSYMIFLAGALIGITIRRLREPIPENTDHRMYRLSMTFYAVFLAVIGTFVEGGIGWLVLPYKLWLWKFVDAASWGIASLFMLALAKVMTWNISCLRLEVAFPELFGKPKAKAAHA